MEDYADVLLSLLKNVGKQGQTAAYTIQCLVKRMSEIEITDFIPDQVATIESSRGLYPGAIIVLRKLSETTHGQQIVSKAKDIIDEVIHILTEHRQFAGCATSILVYCILGSCDSCMVFGNYCLTKSGVIKRILRRGYAIAHM